MSSDVPSFDSTHDRLTRLLGATSDGHWEWDVASDRVWYSPRFRALLGYTDETLPNTRAARDAILHADDALRFQHALDGHVRTGAPLAIEVRMRGADGAWRRFAERAHATLGADGRVAFVTGTVSTPSATHSGDRFRELAATVHEVFYVARLDATGTPVEVEYVSPAYRDIWGRDPDELLVTPRAWMDAVHPDDRASVKAALPRDVSGGFDIVYRVVRPDGTVRWVRDVALPIDPRTIGTPEWRIAGAVADITAERVATLALSESEQRFRTVLEALHEGIALVDGDGRVRLCNPAAERILGFAPGELVGRSVWSPDWSQVFEDGRAIAPDEHPIARVLATGREQTGISIGARRADGPLVWLNVDIVPAPVAPLAVICTFTDITAHRAAAAETARLAAIVESSNDAIVAMALDGTVSSWNPGAERMLGYAAHDVVGRSLALIVPQDTWNEERALLDRIARGDSVGAIEVERVRRDGTRIPVALSLSGVRDARGVVAGIAAIMQDVSARRTLEAELRQAQKMEAIGRLAGGVAHDFNNLLTAILANAQFALRELSTGTQVHADVEEIRRAAERAAGLTRQLLAFSRKQPHHPRPIDVNALVEGVRKLLHRVIGEHVRLETTIGAGPARVVADPGLFEQALVNLAVNARDAMPGGGTLRLAAERVATLPSAIAGAFDAPHGAIVVSVTDSGHGMDARTAARAFEPFFTTKREGKGTGLGLSSVYGFAQQSGGAAWLTSSPGAGTTVSIALPATADVLPDASDSADGTRRRMSSSTVLLVEDDDAVRTLAARILADDGYRAITASNGSEALARWVEHRGRDGRVDAIVTDVVMPGVGGPALVQRLREDRPDIPVVFMSGYIEGGAAAMDLAGPTTLIEKPFDAAILLGALRALLDADA